MLGIVGIAALMLSLALSLLISRIATVALAMTGLSHQAASFQARSAFTGTGFTTTEAEKVVDHPVRRKIVMVLMVVRSAGLVTIVISLILAFVGPAADETKLLRVGIVVAVVVGLWLLSMTPALGRLLDGVIGWALTKWTDLDVRDYANLLHLSGEYQVHELHIDEDDWLADRPLRDCELQSEGVLVLGILRDDGDYVGAPRGNTEVYPGDTVILYGRGEVLRQLDERRRGAPGDVEHEQSVGQEQQRKRQQEAQEAQQRARREDEKRKAPQEQARREGREEK
jgi:hypothetical protein